MLEKFIHDDPVTAVLWVCFFVAWGAIIFFYIVDWLDKKSS